MAALIATSWLARAALPVCLQDFEANAQQKLPRAVWEYYASGANDEETMRDNEQAYRRWVPWAVTAATASLCRLAICCGREFSATSRASKLDAPC